MRGGKWLAALAGVLIACGRSMLTDYAAPNPEAPPPVVTSGEAGRPASTARPPVPGQVARAGASAAKPRPPVVEPMPTMPPVVAGMTRTILDGELENARDLGGVPLGPGRMVAYGELFRGPPLAGLSDGGCEEVDRLGIRTVIDLRIDPERASRPEAACVQRSAQLVAAPLPVPYDLGPAAYLEDLHATDSLAVVFRALGDPEAYPIYFHCTYGRDRTGVLAAVILLALGANRDAIMQEYLLSRATVGAYPNSLEAVFDDIERSGGIENYLTRSGIPTEHLATLRAQATDGE